MAHVLVVLVSLLAVQACLAELDEYWRQRKELIEREQDRFLGARIVLNAKEQQVNRMLMKAKHKDFDAGLRNPGSFPPARHFFNAREDIENSVVFKIIRAMPKGAALHGHDTGLVSEDFLFNLTYRENLYCCQKSDVFLFHFLPTPDFDQTCAWRLVADLRRAASNVSQFDADLRKRLTLTVPDPRVTYPDINAVWTAFQQRFSTVSGLLTYRPVFEETYTRILTEFAQDNVMYLEFRGTLPDVYELDGTIHSGVAVVSLYYNVTAAFLADQPSFWGARFIYGPPRHVDNATVEGYIHLANSLLHSFPDFVAGFDLVGQEDLGRPLSDFVPMLLDGLPDARFFFHAGETDWQGTDVDRNLVDAVMLNTTRIGHGYALLKHPVLLREVKDRNIGIEVNPISNQVLMLVDDLRNHPAAALLADDYPVVISCDDPSFWGAKALSYDFYEAFMGLAGRDADLRVLKQLAINSIKYSAMGHEEKVQALASWEHRWNSFVDRMVGMVPALTVL